MRQIAERMVKNGHEVTIATSQLNNRNFDSHNGVRIVEFAVTGNLTRGLEGEIERYQSFLANFNADAIMIKAAQQWTFDASWPVLDLIKARKVFIPCGFSGLYEPEYAQYFCNLPNILRKFDHLIFYAERYRDIDFVKNHGMQHFSIVPNGACEEEFSAIKDSSFRERHGIPESSFLLLTVGSMTGMKGHREVAEAVARLNSKGRHVTLILNGNRLPSISDIRVNLATPSKCSGIENLLIRFRHLGKRTSKLAGKACRAFRVYQKEGWKGVWQRIATLLGQKKKTLDYWINDINHQVRNKKILQLDLPRTELIQAYKASDLFVFASNIEYSPLVLFESTAAGLPFLSVPVGNAEEIAEWTGGGCICPALKDERGYTRVDPELLSKMILELMDHPEDLRKLGENGHAAWRERFNWLTIAKDYEEILSGVVSR
ncbi:glycosyltransferase family 4 protein [Novimethylophilus kurashikiensis]|nr:glycosyltransferase family 4 protein [Novimethylophilus kurashikiensis]